jgi:phosphoadenosine phosphosulfate reductase
VKHHYGLALRLYYPRHDLEAWTREHGINAFYESVELRKGCCHFAQGRTAATRARRPQGLDHRHARAAIGDPRRPAAAQLSTPHGDGGLEKFNPLAAWSEREVWAYLKLNQVPYNALHDKFYPSIGCAPCTRPVTPGEDVRAGRWWWENPESKECGLHVKRA